VRKNIKGQEFSINFQHILDFKVRKKSFFRTEIREGTNEIKAFKPLLKGIEINGAVVTADAMHCQRENAKFLVEEKGADCLPCALSLYPTWFR